MKTKSRPAKHGAASINVRFRCLCGRDAGAGYESDGTPIVLHSTPPCDLFIELEADEYLSRINRARIN